MQIVTLLFLRRDQEILLAMKKRGTGAGKWNGVGGKVNTGESNEAAARRECLEEIGVSVVSLSLVAKLEFSIPHRQFHNLAYVYFASEWLDEPMETEEMAPKWFNITDIPYEVMWADDIYWLPSVLAGAKIGASFIFDANDQLIEATIRPLTAE